MSLTCLLNANPKCMERCEGKDKDGNCILKKDELYKNKENDL